MRNFILAMIVVFLVLCVPWFCVAQASSPEMREVQRRFYATMKVGLYCSQVRMHESIDGKCKLHEGFTKEDARAHDRCGERVELECNFRNIPYGPIVEIQEWPVCEECWEEIFAPIV